MKSIIFRKYSWRELAGMFLLVAITTVIHASPASAIGANFFDDWGTGAADCDIFDWRGQTPQCNGNPDRSVRVKAGQTNRVPIQYVHVRAYFVPNSDASGNNPRIPAGANYRIVIRGADFCPAAGGGAFNNRDNRTGGYYEAGSGHTIGNAQRITEFSVSRDNVAYREYQRPDNSLLSGLVGQQPYSTGAANTRTVVYGLNRNAVRNCGDQVIPVTNTMLAKAEGVIDRATRKQVYYVNVVARHLDQWYPNTNRPKCTQNPSQNLSFSRCDGISNGFTIEQGGSSGLFGVGSVGQAGGGNGERSFGVTYTSGNPNIGTSGNNEYFSTVLRFGSDCTVRAGGSVVSAMFYDLDGGLPFRVAVNKTTRGGQQQHLVPTPGRGSFAYASPTGASNRTREGRWVNGHVTGHRYNQSSAGGLNNNGGGFSYVTFRANPGDIFELYLMGARADVVNQYSLPFSAIYYKSPCLGSEHNLVPNMTGVRSREYVEAGARLSPRGSVTNSLPDSTTSNWQVSMATYGPSNNANPPTNGSDTTSAACAYASARGANSCERINNAGGSAGSNEFVGNTTRNIGGTPTYDIPDDVPVGTKVCFFTSVNKYHGDFNASNNWRHSAMYCAVVGKLPRVQVWGYDAKVMGDINTSLSRLGSRNYGSYSEYGLLSDGINTNMASGNGLLGGESGPQPQWSALTFANQINGLPGFGRYNGIVPFSASRNGVIEGGSNVTLGSKTYSAGTRQIIHYTGTLIINGSQKYDNTHSSIGGIPRVLIFADNVVVGPNATQIDPWIITNNLNTCSQVRNGSNYFAAPSSVQIDDDMCEDALTFNGPVIAKNVYLYRTAGRGKSPNNHAEVFNLRADAFLSSYAGRGTELPVATTDVVTELPPRF